MFSSQSFQHSRLYKVFNPASVSSRHLTVCLFVNESSQFLPQFRNLVTTVSSLTIYQTYFGQFLN